MINIEQLRAAVQRRIYRWFHRKPWNIEIPGGMASITFDDFPVSAAETANRILVENGWRGTYYLATGMLGTDSECGMIISEQHLDPLSSEGHEIGNHTHSHLKCVRISRKTLENELHTSEQILNGYGGVKQFAFPYGAYDDSSVGFLSGRFRTMRTVEAGVNSGVTDLNLLKAVRLYSPLDLNELERLIAITKSRSGWLIFYTHDVSENASRFGCSTEDFEAFMSILKEAKMPVRTVSEVCDLLSIPSH